MVKSAAVGFDDENTGVANLLACFLSSLVSYPLEPRSEALSDHCAKLSS